MCECPKMDYDPCSSFVPLRHKDQTLGQFLGQFLGISFVDLTGCRVSGIDRIGADTVRLLDNFVRPRPICPMVRAI